MADEKLIHVKLEYEEALKAKRDILSSEMGLLRIARAIKNYRISRTEELRLKLQLYKKIKELKANIAKLQQVLPKIRIPEILSDKKNSKKEEAQREYIPKKKDLYYDELEYELQEIQRKLKSLE